MRSLGEVVKGEIRELTPVVIYFFLALNVLGFTRALILREYGISVSTFVNASIGIVHNVLWKTLLYMLARSSSRFWRTSFLCSSGMRVWPRRGTGWGRRISGPSRSG